VVLFVFGQLISFVHARRKGGKPGIAVEALKEKRKRAARNGTQNAGTLERIRVWRRISFPRGSSCRKFSSIFALFFDGW
jgi:hypothetical protein